MKLNHKKEQHQNQHNDREEKKYMKHAVEIVNKSQYVM